MRIPRRDTNSAALVGRNRTTLAALALLLAAGCGHSSHHGSPAASTHREGSSTAGISVIRPEQRDIRMTVTQPGTIQAFEVTPIYSHISGYVDKYLHNIGDRVKTGEVLLEMWVPDLVETHRQRVASVHKAKVEIEVAESALRAAESMVRTTEARVASARAGVKRAQATYTRWDSEFKRLQELVTQRVLDEQVRDETYRQFQEAVAGREQAEALVSETGAERDRAAADRDRAKVDVEAARASLAVSEADERLAKVTLDYGRIKAPYDGVLTQRNVSPGDYLQPGGGSMAESRPLFVLEQIDPVRVFVGVPELASFFIKEGDTALIRFQAIPGATREGKVVRSGFSLNPSTRTLQTEIDVSNSDGHLHPGWYATVSIVVERKEAWTLPPNAIAFEGQQNYFVYLNVDGKPVRTQVIVGPSDDTHTSVLKKYVPGAPSANTNAWPEFDGTERVFAGNLEVLRAEAKAAEASK